MICNSYSGFLRDFVVVIDFFFDVREDYFLFGFLCDMRLYFNFLVV